MKTNNRAVNTRKTFEGGPALPLKPIDELKRAVMTCLLWEDCVYENGQSIADRIGSLIALVTPEEAVAAAKYARKEGKLRHVPLFIAKVMAGLAPNWRRRVSGLLAEIVQRPDELTEFLSLYWKDGRKPISKQVKLGLARAFTKFDEYALAKYNRYSVIKLRDVLFMAHAKPVDSAQANLWKRLIDDKLTTPDTWEVELSANGNTKDAWERLLRENKLGSLALLRNLRNMSEKKVDRTLIREALLNMKTDRVLPYRFIAAARHAPDFEPWLEVPMFCSMEGKAILGGRTILLVDVSGSMDYKLSDKSEMTRLDAACGLAILCRELCYDVTVLTFSTQLCKVPPRKGFALRDVIVQSQPHQGTHLGEALKVIEREFKYDRIIVITDEQSADSVGTPGCGRGYMINVAPYAHSVGYGKWIRINGWSEAILDYITAYESSTYEQT